MALVHSESPNARDALRELIGLGLDRTAALAAFQRQVSRDPTMLGDLVESFYELVDVEVVYVTPETAAEWLDRNTRNRNLRKTQETVYARDMANGRWRWTGDTVKFDTDGVLIDGQHRLHGIVESGVTVKTLVVSGLDPKAQFNVDRGAGRRTGDVFTIQGLANSNTLAAIVRVALNWDRGRRRLVNSGLAPASIDEQWEFLCAHPELHEVTAKARSYRHIPRLNRQTIGLCLWLFWQLDAEQAVAFFDKLDSAVGFAEGDPLYTLWRSLDNRRAEEKNNGMDVDVWSVVKCWNAVRTGRPCRRLYVDRFRESGDLIDEPV